MRTTSMRTTSITLLIFLGSLSGTWCPAAHFTLTEDGEAKSVIVLADAPSPAIKTAASVLHDHIRAISGAELKIMTASAVQADQQGKTLVLVGMSSLVDQRGLSTERLGAFRPHDLRERRGSAQGPARLGCLVKGSVEDLFPSKLPQ